MKKLTVLTLTLVLTALAQLTAQPVQAEVSIPDANLAAAIREALGLPPGAAITSNAMLDLTELEAAGKGITALTGLEYAVNLTRLDLGGAFVNDERHTNPISDVSPLAGLTQLWRLDLNSTAISDVSPLAGLTQLTYLYLGATAVSDVSPLANLTQLRSLNLGATAVSDVSPLAALTQLTWLYLNGTDVSDVSPLAALTQLTELYLGTPAVSDVSPLAALTQLWRLYLNHTAVSDVSPLAALTQLRELHLGYTAVSDVSPLANLTQLETLELQNCPLNAASHQTHIPTIQANGTEVAFDPFKPIHLPQVPSLVSLIYFRPSDIPVRPNVDAEIDGLIKKVQRFYADEMERHGFGRKTFQFETDAHGNAVVHHVNGKFTEAYYKQNVGGGKEIREQIYIPPQSITVEMLDGDLFTVAGVGGGSPYGGGGAAINSWDWHVIAHELGHAFGMNDHDFRSDSYLMSYGHLDEELSPCFAAWLDVHPAFNPTVVQRNTHATIQMLPATLAAPPNAIRLRFTVTAPAGSLYQARLLTPEKTTLGGYAFNTGGLIGCKRIDGNPTSSTVEFVTALTPDTESVSLQIIGIDGDVVGGQRFPIDVASLLATEEVPQLVADVNGDGVVDIQDLVLVFGQFGETGKNSADVNGDGEVDIDDLIAVAEAMDAAAGAPAIETGGVETGRTLLQASDVRQWIRDAKAANVEPAGIAALERLLAALTRVETPPPRETVLLANYPNPFNPETWIPYQLSEPAEVTVTIYAANGAVVRTLDLGHRRAGSYDSRSRAAYWDGRNAAGEPVASGVYFYTLSAGDFKATRKMVIRK